MLLTNDVLVKQAFGVKNKSVHYSFIKFTFIIKMYISL